MIQRAAKSLSFFTSIHESHYVVYFPQNRKYQTVVHRYILKVTEFRDGKRPPEAKS